MIKQVCSKLICILCKRSNLNQSVLKMVATALINTLSLLCNEDSILQNIIDILHMEDSNSSVFLVWSNEEKTPTKIDVHSMISLKIVLAAGICEQNWWHAVNYHSTIMLIISTMSLYCCTKLLHHMLFALQTLRCCLDHTLKQNDVPLDESLQSKIFEVLLGNWENYIPSVMDQNLLLCESFIKCLKQKNSEVNKEKFWHFLTNVSCTLKSKYYMMGVCFLSDFYYDDVLDSWLIDNMVYSLSRSYLVTAGAWCHKVLVKNVLTEEKWKNTFLEKVIDLVCYSDICIRQNVCNYWLPTAIKYYPNIIQLLYDRVIEKYNVIQKHCWVTKEMYCKNRNIDELQRYLHSVILIVKLERPAKFNTITYNCVQEALKCSDELIRGDAFLCCQTFNGVKSHVPMQGMSAESCQVFQDIFQFLEENINCDDANLRQTIYKVFKNYVRNTEGQFHKCAVPIDLVVRTKGTSEPFKLPEFMDNYVKQYSRLYTFFIGNLADGSNYQRLITTLNLLNILLENMQPHMTENQKKKRKPTIDYLREIGKWNFESSECRERLFNCLKDDTNDVRSMAKHVLQCYFNYTKEEVSLFLTNLQSSLRMSQSNVFYTAESGAYAVAVLVNLFYKAQYDRMELRNSLSQVLNCSMDSDELDALCKAVTELGLNSNLDKSLEHNLFSTYFLNQCLVQSEFLQKDILLAVKNRNSLHGSLTTLMLLLTDPTSPEFCGLDPNQVQSLLNLLNETCLYLLDILCMKSRSTNFAPSFGEMGEAMNSLINVTDDTEQLTLTPAHQTLFNCIWMNLKICCTFASELAVAYRNKLSRDQIVFSCGIVSHVLHKCRHKGAIQNAGLALANIVSKCLYQDPYPLELLQYTLKSVLECTVGGTVSRKSAGVAILVHKLLASNHSMKEKLFTTAMEKILEVANSPVLPSEETLKVDLPQAIAFHMLQFLVADSGLRVTMAAYLEQITMVCFEKMNCKEWTVRNAALQVFGVLLPKLVGTKKQDSENQSSNVAFEEFFYQLPDIGNCLKSVLSSVNDTNTSVLVSALTLLSRLKTTGDLFHVKQDYMALKEFLSDIFPALLSSNIYTVRFLTANCYVNILHKHTDLQEHFEMILLSCLEFIFGSQALVDNFHSPNIKSFLNNKLNYKIVNENHLHGSLLTLENLKEKLHLENLKLDSEFLVELLVFLNSDIPCVVNIKFSTYSLLFKIFRHENEFLGPKNNPKKNPLDLLSCLLVSNDVKAQIGWKLYVQEVIKFHMFNSLFISDNIDYNYIVHLIHTLRQESDALNDVLLYLSHLLKDFSTKTKLEMSEKYSNNEQNAKSRNRNQQAQSCIKAILKIACTFQVSKICLEQVFNIVIQIYSIFIDDEQLRTISPSSLIDTEFLDIGSTLFENNCSKKSIEYTCPLVLPVLSICALFAHSEERTTEMNTLLKKIGNLSNTFIYNENCNEEFRLSAAMSMSILYKHFHYKSLYAKDLTMNAIHLLQDEVYEVRQEITYFVRNLQRSLSDNPQSCLLLKNPYVCLFSLLSPSFTNYVDFHVLLEVLSHILFINDLDIERYYEDAEFCNPFDHNIRNFYSEPIFVAQYAKTLFCTKITANRNEINKSELSKLLDKYNIYVEEYSSNVHLNEQGRVKMELLKEVALSMKNILQHLDASSVDSV